MGKYSIIIAKPAQKELQAHYKTGNKSTLKRLERIFQELTEHPQTGIGKPEALKHEFTGYWSRQITKKDRLIYRIEDTRVTVYVISANGHYQDK